MGSALFLRHPRRRRAARRGSGRGSGRPASASARSPTAILSDEGFDSLFERIRTIEPEAAAHDIAFGQMFDPRFAQAAQNI